jgi:hypothetical protein
MGSSCVGTQSSAQSPDRQFRSILQSQHYLSIRQLFFLGRTQFIWKTGEPCLAKLLTASCPSLPLVFAAPRWNIETNKSHKTITVQRAFHFRCDFLLDREPEEGLLVPREADALGRESSLVLGHLFCSFKSFLADSGKSSTITEAASMFRQSCTVLRESSLPRSCTLHLRPPSDGPASPQTTHSYGV